MAKLTETRRLDHEGRRIKEARGPDGEVALVMHPRFAGRCAACDHPYPITRRDVCVVVKNLNTGWCLYHLDAACRPTWVEL